LKTPEEKEKAYEQDRQIEPGSPSFEGESASRGASEMDFLIRITAPERPFEKARPQLNLGLVLDRSGSMSGRKIERRERPHATASISWSKPTGSASPSSTMRWM
jgi:hypothetical protein